MKDLILNNLYRLIMMIPFFGPLICVVTLMIHLMTFKTTTKESAVTGTPIGDFNVIVVSMMQPGWFKIFFVIWNIVCSIGFGMWLAV